MKTVVLSKDTCVAQAADQIEALLRSKPAAVLAFSAGRTMAPLFSELSSRCANGSLSFRGVTLFAVTEFENVPDGKTAHDQLMWELVSPTDLPLEQCHFLSADTFAGYDDAIAACGGLDMAVLGLGVNAHIGYNEPAVPFDSLTHRQKLTDKTRRQLEPLFGDGEAVPSYAWTMGIKTLVSARRILVLAFGQEKEDAVFQMLYARDDSVIPAAFLQIPPEVLVYADQEAARKLSL